VSRSSVDLDDLASRHFEQKLAGPAVRTVKGGGLSVSRRLLQHDHPAPDDCPSDEFHCWMRCYTASELPGCAHALTCASDSNGKPCEPNQEGCSARCVPIVPTPASNAVAPATDAQRQEALAKYNSQFCQADSAVSMYMAGFQQTGNPATSCVVFLFKGWILDSPGKFAGACIGTLLLAVFLEGLIFFRKFIRTSPPRKHRKWLPVFEILLFGSQACLGYMLMLVAMTYSSALFSCTVLGLMIGHGVFNLKAAPSDSATPCCEGMEYDNNMKHENNKSSEVHVAVNDHNAQNAQSRKHTATADAQSLLAPVSASGTKSPGSAATSSTAAQSAQPAAAASLPHTVAPESCCGHKEE
jgi:hypothetical protein